mgnify:CR=1 FL=1
MWERLSFYLQMTVLSTALRVTYFVYTPKAFSVNMFMVGCSRWQGLVHWLIWLTHLLFRRAGKKAESTASLSSHANFYPLLVTYRLTVLATWRTNHLYALVRLPDFSSNKRNFYFLSHTWLKLEFQSTSERHVFVASSFDLITFFLVHSLVL